MKQLGIAPKNLRCKVLRGSRLAWTVLNEVSWPLRVLAIGMVLAGSIGPNQSQPFQPTARPKGDVASRVAHDQVLGNFLPSIEMRESAEFLLTPALLVQELFETNVIPTYPNQ